MIDVAYVIAILPRLGQASLITIQATFLGMCIALVLGLVLALARRSKLRVVGLLGQCVVEFVRSTPLLIQLYFLFYVLPELGGMLSPLTTGVIGLGVYYSAYLAEVYRAGIESVPQAQWDSAHALNFSKRQMWQRVILPQAIPPVLPAIGNYVVAMFKETPLLASITVLEMMQTAKIVGAQTFRYVELMMLVGLFFLSFSLLASWGLRVGEQHFARHPG